MGAVAGRYSCRGFIERSSVVKRKAQGRAHMSLSNVQVSFLVVLQYSYK